MMCNSSSSIPHPPPSFWRCCRNEQLSYHNRIFTVMYNYVICFPSFTLPTSYLKNWGTWQQKNAGNRECVNLGSRLCARSVVYSVMRVRLSAGCRANGYRSWSSLRWKNHICLPAFPRMQYVSSNRRLGLEARGPSQLTKLGHGLN